MGSSPLLIRVTSLTTRNRLNVRSRREKSSNTLSRASASAASSTTCTVTGIPMTSWTRRTATPSMPMPAAHAQVTPCREWRVHYDQWVRAKTPARPNQGSDEMTRLLDGKRAIIYGAGGGIGGGVARTFAREGATVFLAGRTKTTLNQVADEITASGGLAHVAVV